MNNQLRTEHYYFYPGKWEYDEEQKSIIFNIPIPAKQHEDLVCV